MPSTPRVILLEFNELTPSLMDRFIAEGHLPNFQRLYRESGVFVTDAEESQWDLEPWIQWVTVHTGLSLAQHGLHNLDESYKLKSPNVWDLLSAAGHRVWVCGSMNVKYNRPIDGWVLPDAWSSRVDPYPDDLRRYFDFVRTSVGEHTNDKVPLSKAQYFWIPQVHVHARIIAGHPSSHCEPITEGAGLRRALEAREPARPTAMGPVLLVSAKIPARLLDVFRQ